MCTTDQAIDRQVAHENEACRLEKALAEQPQISAGYELLGVGHFAELHVEFYGTAYLIGKRLEEVDLEDVVLSGTKVSLNSAVLRVGAKEWDDMEQQAFDSYENSLGILL